MDKKKKKYICVVFRDLGEDRKKEWRDLWGGSESRHIFNSPDFFESCCEAFGIKKIAVIFCYRKGNLCGVLPLVEDRVFGLRAFLCPGRKGNYIDKSALLLRGGNKEVLDILVAKALELGNVYLAETDVKTKSMIDPRMFPHEAEWASRSLRVEISPEGDTLRFMPSGQKRNLLRRIRWREKDLEFRFFETDLEEALQKVIEIEKKSHKPSRRMALFGRRETVIFFHTLIRRSPGSVRIGILYFRGEPAATITGFVYGGTFAGYHTAFLKQHWNWGAGKAVIYFLIEHLKEKGFSKLDLLRGDSDVKRQFAEDAEDRYNIYFSKNRAVLLWWRVCFSLRYMLKKAMISAEKAPAAFISDGKKLSAALSGILNSYLKSLTDIFSKRRDLPVKAGGKAAEKKIVVFSTYDSRGNPYYGGGGASAVHEVARRLAGQYEVHVLAGRYPGSLRREFLEGVHYERVGSSIFGPKLGHIIFHFLIPFYAARNEFDIWIESFTPPFSTSFTPVFTNKPVIGLAHMLSGRDMRRKYKLPFHYVESFGLKRYRHIIATSAYFRNYITAQNPKAKIAEIANGVSLDEFRSAGGCAGEYISFLGRIEVDQKGIDILLESYRMIAGKIDVPLVIAGAGSAREEELLIRLVRKSGLEGWVILKGRISDKEKITFLRQSRLNVVPSRFETFSLVALETLAAGTPLVSFDIEGLRWIPDQCSIKAAAFDPVSLAEAILRGIKDRELRKKMIGNANAFVENFGWDDAAERYGKLINEILKDHGSKHR